MAHTPEPTLVGFTMSEWLTTLRALEPPVPETYVTEFSRTFFGEPVGGPERPGLNLTRPLLRALADRCANGNARVQKILDALPQELRRTLDDF